MKKPNTSIVAVAAAFILVAASARAAEFQQSVEYGQGHYLATESGNWTSGENHFFLNPYTVTFNTADLSFSDAIRIRSASGAFGDAADILSDSNH